MENTKYFFICLDVFRYAQTIWCSLLVSHEMKGHIFFSRLNSLTEDKSWHQFNGNVLVLCYDLISCHPSPLVIPGPPHRATTASGDNSQGYGLTGGSPCTAALRERCTCSRPGCSVAFMREHGAESSPVSRVQTRSCWGHGAVKWKACHSLFRLMPSDCERLCHVPWLLTQWLGTSRQKPEPVRALCVLTEKCVFHLSSHWPEDSAGLTCPHPQSLTSWTHK